MDEEPRADTAQADRPRRSILDMPWNTFLVLLGAIAILIASGVAVALSSFGGANAPPSAPADAGLAAQSESPAGRPPDSLTSVPDGAPTSVATDAPATDSEFTVEAQKLRDELTEHNVPFTDADATAIIAIGEQNVARNIPDLTADDPVITEQVDQMFPHYTRQQRRDVVRCVAEHVEEVIAHRTGDGIQPDERDRQTG